MVFGAREGDVRRFDAPGVTEMTIGGLDVTAAGALLAERAGVEVSDEVRDVIVARTGGNPLALVELPTVLSRPELSGTTPMPAVLPLTAGVERTFLDRCRRLTSQAQVLLLVASADDSGQVEIIQGAAAALNVGDEALGEAERSGLVRVNGAELHFRHPLVRSAVYGAATVQERQRAHGALAAALRAAGEDDRRAWHLALGHGRPRRGSRRRARRGRRTSRAPGRARGGQRRLGTGRRPLARRRQGSTASLCRPVRVGRGSPRPGTGARRPSTTANIGSHPWQPTWTCCVAGWNGASVPPRWAIGS